MYELVKENDIFMTMLTGAGLVFCVHHNEATRTKLRYPQIEAQLREIQHALLLEYLMFYLLLACMAMSVPSTMVVF